jgi:hypothetical protein
VEAPAPERKTKEELEAAAGAEVLTSSTGLPGRLMLRKVALGLAAARMEVALDR